MKICSGWEREVVADGPVASIRKPTTNHGGIYVGVPFGQLQTMVEFALGFPRSLAFPVALFVEHWTGDPQIPSEPVHLKRQFIGTSQLRSARDTSVTHVG